MNLSLAIDPIHLAAPLLSSLAGKVPAEGEGAENGFAAMVAGVEPAATEGESPDIELGSALPATGNSLPPVLLPVAASEASNLAQRPITQSQGEPAEEQPFLTVAQPKLANPASDGWQPAAMVNLPLPPTMPTDSGPAKAEGALQPTSASTVPIAAAPTEISPKAIIELAAQLQQKPAEVAAGEPTTSKVAPPVVEQAPLPASALQSQPMIQPTSTLPAQNSPPLPAAAPAQPATHGQLESLIDSLVQAREGGRSARGEIVLRHAEFGTIAVKLDQGEGDMLARISSRDPGFAPAAQAALAERQSQAVAASTEGQSAQNRSQDGSAPQGQSRDMGFASQQDRSGSNRDQRPATTSQAQSAHPLRPSAEQRPTSPRDGSLLA